MLTTYFTPNLALFSRHDPHPIPPATPRAPNFSDPPRSAPPQLSIAPERYETWQHKLPLFPQLAALFYLSLVAHDSDRDERVRIANYKAGPSPKSHGRATAKSTTSSNLLQKVNRVAFTELFDDDTMMLKTRIQFELLRVLHANPRGNGRKARAARDT